MKIKSGASLERVQWQMFHASLVVEEAMNDMGYECVITAGTDGKHMLNSLHYQGRAIDYRTRHIPAEDAILLRDQIALRLGTDYDVVYETQGPTHFHVEYDPD